MTLRGTRLVCLVSTLLLGAVSAGCGVVTVKSASDDSKQQAGANEAKRRKAVDDALAARKQRQADAESKIRAGGAGSGSGEEGSTTAQEFADQEAKNQAERDKVAKANGLAASAIGLDAFLTSAVVDGAAYKDTLVFIDDIDESKCIQSLPDKCLFQIEGDGQPILYWLTSAEPILEGAAVSATPIGAVKITGVATHKTALGSRQAFVVLPVVQ